MNNSITLNKIEIKGKLVEYHFITQGEPSQYFKGDCMFCEFEHDMADVPQGILAMPFVGSFVSLTWICDAVLWLPVLDRTYYNSMKRVKVALQEMHYNYPFRGRLVPAILETNLMPESDNAMLLFGGGVDAHCSYIRHRECITDIINIQGWFDSLGSTDKAAEDDWTECDRLADREQVFSNKVRSNFASIFNGQLFDKKYKKRLHDSWWHGFQHAQAFLSIAAALAFKLKVSHLIIGSSNTFGDFVSCNSDVTTDGEMQFAGVGQTMHDGYELNRQEKMRVIVNYQRKSDSAYPIKVCSFNDHNCCQCEKCFRTILEIIAEGGDIKKLGFSIDTSLIKFFQTTMEKRLALWGYQIERKVYWKDSISRMKENWDNITEKEFCEWFLNYDFDKNKNRLLRQYYFKNFFSIIKRKLHLS